MTERWYVVQTKPVQEKRAIASLRELGFETYFPMGRVEIRKKGQPAEMLRPLLNSYGFVRFDVDHDEWWHAMYARGVNRFVELLTLADGRKRPRPVPDGQIDALKRKLAEFDGPAPIRFDRPKYIPPQTIVRILFGPFEGFFGPVALDQGTRVDVLLRFAGVQRKVTLSRACIATV